MRLESEDQMFGSVKPVSGLVDLYDEFRVEGFETLPGGHELVDGRLGELRVPEVQVREALALAEQLQRLFADARAAGQLQRGQPAYLGQQLHTFVSDRVALRQIEHGQLRQHPDDDLDACVRDVAAGQLQRLKIGQPTGQVEQPGSVVQRRRQDVLQGRVVHGGHEAQVQRRQHRAHTRPEARHR